MQDKQKLHKCHHTMDIYITPNLNTVYMELVSSLNQYKTGLIYVISVIVRTIVNMELARHSQRQNCFTHFFHLSALPIASSSVPSQILTAILRNSVAQASLGLPRLLRFSLNTN